MAGFYNVPFVSVAPKAAETAANLVKDSFMDVARCIRARIYAFMNVQPESCEVLKVGENKQLDKILEEYLKCYKNMGKSNELRKQRYVARFSMRCWNAVLMAEKKQNVNHYFFQWLRSSTPEEEIYQNLIDLETGKTTLKELNSKLTDTVGTSDAASIAKEHKHWENQKKEFVGQIEALKEQLQDERNNSKLLKRREDELKKQVVDLKKALTDEQSTVAKLRASLKEILAEKELYKSRLEIHLQAAERQRTTSMLEIQKLKTEMSDFKMSFISRETDTVDTEEVPAIDVLQSASTREDPLTNVERSASKRRANERKERIGNSTTVSRHAEVKEGVSLLRENVSFVLPGGTCEEDDQFMDEIDVSWPLESEEVETVPMHTDIQREDEDDEGDEVDEDDNLPLGIVRKKMRSHSEQETHGTVCQIVEEVFDEDDEDDNLPLGIVRKKMRSHLEQGTHVTVCQIEEEEHSEKKEEWVAVGYSRDLRYIGKVVSDKGTTLMVRFLERRDGTYEIKKNSEEVEKSLVFMRDVPVKWIGPGRYEIAELNTVKKEHEEHWRLLRLREKVDRFWDITNLTQVVCQPLAGDALTVADIKTIQPNMSKTQQTKMLALSPKFRVGWLNDKVINASLKALEGSSKKGWKVLAADSLLLEKIHSTEIEMLPKWRWIQKEYFMKKDLVIVPVNHGNHWTLGVVKPANRKLLHFDSYADINSGGKEFFFTCMRKLLAAWKINTASWREETPQTPQQEDAKSCGVYVLKKGLGKQKGKGLDVEAKPPRIKHFLKAVAENVVNRKEPFILKDEMNKYRYEIAASLLKKTR